LRAIDQAARSRYRSLAGFERFADAEPIYADRFTRGTALVVTRSGRRLGFVLVQAMERLAYLANISVLPDASGSGVGVALLKGAEGQAIAI